MPNQVTSVNNGKLSYKKLSTKLSKAVKEDTKRYQKPSNCQKLSRKIPKDIKSHQTVIKEEKKVQYAEES